MSDCERFHSAIEAYVAGELDASATGPLFAHCRTCKACRQILELHRDLAGLAARTPEPGEAAFERLHARVLDEVARDKGTRAARVERPVRPTGWPLAARSPLPTAAALAAAILLFVAGLFAGRAFQGGAGPNEGRGVTDRLVRAIGAEAASNRDLADVQDSRFTYSNVSARRVDGDRVTLDFDVTTHVQLVEPMRSELVADVLVQALLDPSSTGARLKAMSLAAGAMEPKLRQALIFAMGHDESLAVRLEALAVLSGQLQDREVESAVLGALRDDDSVQMRLLALDALAAHRVGYDRIREAIRRNERPGKEALMVRLAEYEKRL